MVFIAILRISSHNFFLDIFVLMPRRKFLDSTLLGLNSSLLLLPVSCSCELVLNFSLKQRRNFHYRKYKRDTVSDYEGFVTFYSYSDVFIIIFNSV